jgi:hypothetical protein
MLISLKAIRGVSVGISILIVGILLIVAGIRGLLIGIPLGAIAFYILSKVLIKLNYETWYVGDNYYHDHEPKPEVKIPKAVEPTISVLVHGPLYAQRAAAKSLQSKGDNRAVVPLIAVMLNITDPTIRDYCCVALRCINERVQDTPINAMISDAMKKYRDKYKDKYCFNRGR